MKLFKKILIANRGEIAVRIIRSAHELGIRTVAIYSKPDEDALHTKLANESFYIGEQELSETYLNVAKIIEIAKLSGSDAIHPGYGFLAENPELVNACNKEGIAFIGPSLRAIQLMGNKIEARDFVTKLGTPMTKGAVGSHKELFEAARNIPFPILVKAAAGGGGKGMRIVNELSKLQETIEATSREAKSYFGDEEVFIEQFIEDPRHIEIQIIGDKHGNIVHLYERECSIQRRYQKIIEESPSPTLDQATREKMGAAAVDIAKAIAYDSAGTIEFLVDKNLDFYFLEMNTRIQVEHPVTEMVTGIDIVREQILVAANNLLSFEQKDIVQKGHAIEARIYAEEPEVDFRPSPGEMIYYKEPQGSDLRIDTGIEKASTIHSFFDPMISKLICYADNRDVAIERLSIALKDYVIHGISTNITYLISLLNHEAYINNEISTKFCDERSNEVIDAIDKTKSEVNINLLAGAYLVYDFNSRKENHDSVWNQIGYWRLSSELELSFNDETIPIKLLKNKGNYYKLIVNEEPFEIELVEIDGGFLKTTINGYSHSFYISQDTDGIGHLNYEGFLFKFNRKDQLVDTDFFHSESESASGNNIKSPMPGKVIKMNVGVGDKVSKGETILIVEAMKMENNLTANRDVVIAEVRVKEGDMVDNSSPLVIFEELVEE